jgi:Cu2+-exporting ATPase
MLQNLVWATGYKVVGIPLGAGARGGAGIVRAPAVAGALMRVSTFVVAANAQLRRRVDLRREALAPAAATADTGPPRVTAGSAA